MHITVGILAWNEEESIAATIEGLACQSLLQSRSHANTVEVVVVVNGCTDQTANVAERAIESHLLPPHSGRVVDVKEAGKVNAWNILVHKESSRETDIFILADADIRFLGDQTLENMVNVLGRSPEVEVATDQPVKHIALKENPNLLERLSLSISGMTRAAPGQLTGQLYAARATMLRRIIMPKGLIVEDGFLKQFICTDGFKQQLQNSKIQRADEAAHVFKAYMSVSEIIPNQRRQAMGHTIYTYLRDYLLEQKKQGREAECVLKEESLKKPEWFLETIRARVKASGYWVMHSGALMVRWKRLANLKGTKRVSSFPAALMGWGMDLVVYSWANWTLKNGQLKGIWKDTKTSELG